METATSFEQAIATYVGETSVVTLTTHYVSRDLLLTLLSDIRKTGPRSSIGSLPYRTLHRRDRNVVVR